MREGLACRCGRGTLYDVLQVSPWCEPEVIHVAYRALARTRHPDLNRDVDAEDQMRRLNAAYQTLSDPGRRARYDEELALEAARPVVVARPSSTPAREPTAAGWPVNGYPTNGHSGHSTNGHGADGHGANGYGSRSNGAGPRPGAGAAASSTAREAATPAASAPAYRTAVFDTRGEMLFPRSAIYASLVIVTVIVALVAWLILDTMAQRPNVPYRLPRGYDEMQAGPMVATSWRFEVLEASVEPGLSLSDDRWNQ